MKEKIKAKNEREMRAKIEEKNEAENEVGNDAENEAERERDDEGEEGIIRSWGKGDYRTEREWIELGKKVKKKKEERISWPIHRTNPD